MRRILSVVIALSFFVTGAIAQTSNGRVTTSAPSYNTGSTAPLSMDTAGNLRVVNGGSPSGTQNVNLTQITGAAPSLTNPLWIYPATGATFPVSGTFWQSTQPVSIASMPTTPVTGTFWQSTQPVSIASMPTTPVTGTFWQTTQPVSISTIATNSAAINVSTATTTQIVALSGSTKIYVSSFDVIAGGTGNITFVYGTGTNCGTGTASLTGAYPLVAQAGIAKGSGVGPVLVVPSGNALCVTTSAAVQMSGSVSYVQF